MDAEPGWVHMSPSVIVQVSNVMYSTSIFGLVYCVSRTVVLFFTYGNFFFGFVKLLVVSYSGGVFTMHLHSHCILVYTWVVRIPTDVVTQCCFFFLTLFS